MKEFLKTFFGNKMNLLTIIVPAIMLIGINTSEGFYDLPFITRFGLNAFLVLVPVINFLKELSDWFKK